MIDFQNIVSDFCQEHHLQIAFSTDMPDGYETANGTFDIVKNTLFLNSALLASVPEHEALFYLYHELRHALQYTSPQSFSTSIQRSLNYILMYDGTCLKMVDGDWKECHLEGTEQFLLDAYLGQPYEMDAKAYAYQQVKALYGASKNLNELYAFWTPKHRFSDAEYMALYQKINDKIQAQL